MALAQRIINLRFILGQGSLGAEGQDAVDLSGLRVSANIVKQGLGMAQADLQIFGMSLSLMNKLTSIGKLRFEEQHYNTVVISAGDEESGVANVFQGIIRESWADARQSPDVFFHVSADTALTSLMQPVKPISYKGTVDVALVLAGIATQLGLTLENNGVSGKVENPYWPGSPRSQLEKVCEVAGCENNIDEGNKVLAVWPKGKAREGAAVLLSPETGLIGYPSYTQSGIELTSLFNPSLEFGRMIEVKSSLPAASGQWTVAGLAHRLEAMVPNGQWFTDIECNYLDHSA